MTHWLHELYWGNLSPAEMTCQGDAQYKEMRARCGRLMTSLEKKIAPELAEDFEALCDMQDECVDMERERAFALGCGFALRLMLDTVPLWQTEA